MGCTVRTEWRSKQRAVLVGDAWIADGNYHETLDLRVERADTVVVLDMPWWLCSGHAFLRGFRMPGELPEGCDYSHRRRLRDEWLLAVRIWRKRRSEPEYEREILSQRGLSVTLYRLKSKRAVREFLDGLDADHVEANEGEGTPSDSPLTPDPRPCDPRLERHIGAPATEPDPPVQCLLGNTTSACHPRVGELNYPSQAEPGTRRLQARMR